MEAIRGGCQVLDCNSSLLCLPCIT
uniref:Uncharacterized protein n=1 Tax=Rhizophora mucronata TaxID=61149 RepID=A0A2P2LMB0_RHIMU